jgi:hypothetical protein
MLSLMLHAAFPLSLQNIWARGITHATPDGFLWTSPGAPAHSVAHVGMLALMFAAAEQQQGAKPAIVNSLECFALEQVRRRHFHCRVTLTQGSPLLAHHSGKVLSQFESFGSSVETQWGFSHGEGLLHKNACKQQMAGKVCMAGT